MWHYLRFFTLTILWGSLAAVASAQITPSPPLPIALDFAAKQRFQSDSVAAAPNGDLAIFRAFRFDSGSESSTSVIISYRQVRRSGDTSNYEIESVAQVGQNPGGVSTGSAVNPSLSPLLGDGSYAVSFTSNATDIVDGTANGGQHIYLRVHGPTRGSTFETQTILITKNPLTGSIADGLSDRPSVTVIPGIKPTYRVAFYSNAYNLVSGIPPFNPDDPNTSPRLRIYVATVVIEPSGPKLTSIGLLTPAAVDADCVNPRISGDGESVVFESAATNLLAGEPLIEPASQIYLAKRNQTLRLISRTQSGSIGSSSSFNSVISHDGSAIAYATYAENLASGASDNTAIVLCDISKPNGSAPCTQQRVNISATNEIGRGDVTYPPQILQATLSNGAKGLLVAFSDLSDNLVAGDTNEKKDLFIKNMITGEMVRGVVTTTSQQPNDDIDQPALGALGYTSPKILLGFASRATNLYDSAPPVSLNAYLSNVVLSAPPPKNIKELVPIVRDTVRKTPPDVVAGSKRVTISLPKFSLPSVRALISRALSMYAAARNRTRIQYDVRLQKVRGGSRIQRIGTRNRITLRRLTPGNYTVRYRVVVTTSTGRQIRTSFSPRSTVNVPK